MLPGMVPAKFLPTKPPVIDGKYMKEPMFSPAIIILPVEAIRYTFIVFMSLIISSEPADTSNSVTSPSASKTVTWDVSMAKMW